MGNLERLRMRVAVWRKQQAMSSNVARNIKARRQAVGMTQLRLAELLETKQPDVARMERSTYGRYNLNRLTKIAHYLNTTVSELTRLEK